MGLVILGVFLFRGSICFWGFFYGCGIEGMGCRGGFLMVLFMLVFVWRGLYFGWFSFCSFGGYVFWWYIFVYLESFLFVGFGVLIMFFWLVG